MLGNNNSEVQNEVKFKLEYYALGITDSNMNTTMKVKTKIALILLGQLSQDWVALVDHPIVTGPPQISWKQPNSIPKATEDADNSRIYCKQQKMRRTREAPQTQLCAATTTAALGLLV